MIIECIREGYWIAFYKGNGKPCLAEGNDLSEAIRNCLELIGENMG